jgi:hypothetical protein
MQIGDVFYPLSRKFGGIIAGTRLAADIQTAAAA